MAPGCVNAVRVTRVRTFAANPANVDGGGRVSAFPHIIRGFSPHGGDLDQPAGRHRPIAAESGNELLNDFANEPRLVLIGTDVPGQPDIGDFAVPMIFIPFHRSEVARA